jgi:hypothetical protein
MSQFKHPFLREVHADDSPVDLDKIDDYVKSQVLNMMNMVDGSIEARKAMTFKLFIHAYMNLLSGMVFWSDLPAQTGKNSIINLIDEYFPREAYDSLDQHHEAKMKAKSND